ncbi:hypothetical protein GCM10010168_41520 [Actinoplanes ianthinogenes]|uniref:DUF1579 domain-containing protein n=1 Tax=Actinoplanes ianthinogenes TaxID=122358 RepID=A0ABN6CGI8_9ACTN|nr:hypothetical protein [Actinoplanes ianthinogenes]BCJ43538.1 hypothetical protein Aiant_41950 [Actinoplanes ianthinogenes]GGR19381.1 hypothetical protein GCM10010168_41520 [Actinoplanes ianthinogenes]
MSLESNNFDFFVGTWTSTQRRRKKILADCDEWYELTATARCWNVFDGAGNIDEVTFDGDSAPGMTVRLYDAASDQWSLYWTRSGTGVLPLPATVGRFEQDGCGRFYDDEDWEGRPIRVRFLWSRITADSCRWEQAFSTDGGVTWETNWISDFTRVS